MVFQQSIFLPMTLFLPSTLLFSSSSFFTALFNFLQRVFFSYRVDFIVLFLILCYRFSFSLCLAANLSPHRLAIPSPSHYEGRHLSITPICMEMKAIWQVNSSPIMKVPRFHPKRLRPIHNRRKTYNLAHFRSFRAVFATGKMEEASVPRCRQNGLVQLNGNRILRINGNKILRVNKPHFAVCENYFF